MYGLLADGFRKTVIWSELTGQPKKGAR